MSGGTSENGSRIAAGDARAHGGAAAEWPRTTRPRTIAILGWARLSAQQREGSGYNWVASELAAGLALAGHRVCYMRSGLDYSMRPGMFVKRYESWRGVECFDLFNSPNLSPASSNFRNMDEEMSSPAHTRVVLRWLDEIGAEIVHAHSLEGYGLDCVRAIRASGRPVVVTPHNYWFVCPQVDLLHEEKRVCMDYEGGARCASCLDAPRPNRARFRRAVEQLLDRHTPVWISGNAHYFMRWMNAKRLGTLPPKIRRGPRRGFEAIDPEIGRGFDVGGAPEVERHAGLVEHGLRLDTHEKVATLGRAERDTNEKFLDATHHLNVLNNNVYGRRRLAGMGTLEDASMVTPPSDFMLRVYRGMGLDARSSRLVRLGLPHFDQIHRRAKRSPYYDARPWDAARSDRPVRFGFFGTTRNNKGLPVLLEAIALLDKRVRERCVFHIRAGGWDWPMRKKMARYPEVSFLGGYDVYQLIAAAGEYDVGVLPHVWFENSPLVLLENLHAGKFVLASRLGGPPDWIVEPGTNAEHPLGNGLMFTGGAPDELAACIARVVRGEVTLPSPREVHGVSTLRSFPDFVRENEAIYEGLLGSMHAAGRDGVNSGGATGHNAAVVEAKGEAVAGQAIQL
ncbi:MAG: glycosyltransferase [Phycisphaerales bacterium]|jgi:glycosyltransferase involved in cell wall biosynthesis|nr:glycosyltransferase [Phycisphaerales bacterium]